MHAYPVRISRFPYSRRNIISFNCLLQWLMYVPYGSAVAADVILTVSLCISLTLHRRRSLRRSVAQVLLLVFGGLTFRIA